MPEGRYLFAFVLTWQALAAQGLLRQEEAERLSEMVGPTAVISGG